MKAFLYKAKGALALALAMSLCSTQVFAAEALSAEQQGVQVAPVVEKTEEEVAPLPTLTYEEALAKAKKHSPDLRDIQDTADFLQETKEDLWDSGYFNMPTYDYQKWVNDGWWAVTSAAFQTDMGMQQNSIGRKLTELALEVTVKSYFTTILSDLDNLELVQTNANMQKKLYQQGQTKYRLGLLSKYNLDQLEIAANQAQDTVKQLEAKLEQEYIKLNNLMGEKSDQRFTFVYDVSYEPYKMNQTMDQYINDKTNNDLTIQLAELKLESAKFGKNYLKESTNSSEQNQNDLTYDQAKRALKTAKEDKALAIRNAYLQIQQLETAYASAQADLTKAQADYRAVQVNYQAGNVTKTAVEQAEMGVLKAEIALRQNAYNHDMLVFTFENPSLLGSSSQS
ncbi:MAG: TolC family protein [Bacteroidales bacterium]|nr:TolC family protein [Anaerotignum sp.]MCI5680348.1 TolC family protein [Bacteroidales bacterium]MDY3926583.1 TolC family protein [Anaerotignum sp.]